MSIAFAFIVQAQPCPIFGRPVHQRNLFLDYGPVLLLMPFGFHLTVDTLPSPISSDPARNYPRLRIWRPSSERQRDLNPPDLCAAQRTLQAHPSPSRLPPLSWRLQLYGFPSPPISHMRDEEGFSSCFSMSLPSCCRYYPARVVRRISQICGDPCCLHPTVAGSASGAAHCRGHFCVHFRYGPTAHCPSYRWSCR